MNPTITSAAVGAGVLGSALLGAAFVGPAGAYGETDTPTPTDEQTDNSVLDEQNDANVQIQDAETPDAEGDEREGRRGRRGGCGLEAAADAIGITETELRAALDEGQSIADVAEANGVYMPIADQMRACVEEGRSALQAYAGLVQNPAAREIDPH